MGRVRITPILQTMLVNQISHVLSHFNNNEIWGAWFCTKNLVVSCPPVVKAKNGVNGKTIVQEKDEIADGLRRITGQSGVNVVLANIRRRREAEELLRQKVLPLFERTLTILYEERYLEDVREPIKGEYGV